MAKARNIEISIKVGGSGDYIIVDKNGKQWGIERKEFVELYQTITSIRDKDSKEGRIYGQLAELKRDYGDRAILMVREYTGMPWQMLDKRMAGETRYQHHKRNISKLKRTVYTFFSERSFAMITMMVKDDVHAAHVMLKLAKALPNVEFYGRGYKVVKNGRGNKKPKRSSK